MPTGTSQLAKSLNHLSETLDRILIELPAPFGSGASLSPLYAPFLARSLLETSFTALVARADPFRILTIGGAQSHSTYDPNIASALAFRWQGDVLTDERSDLWGAKVKLPDVSRALLGGYQEKLFWRPAFELFLDASNGNTNHKDWTAEILRIGINGFIPRYRGLASDVFSRASKGVHHEYVLPPATYFDDASLQVLLDDTAKTVMSFAVVANFCDYFSFKIPDQDALQIYERYQP